MQGSEIQITLARNLNVSFSQMKSSVADPPCKRQDVKSSAGEMDDNSEMKERRDDLISASASASPMEILTGDREALEEEVAKVDLYSISNCWKSYIPCKRWRGRKPQCSSMRSLLRY